ncbi:MAG: phosphotransferase [Geminicoccaceae bacterium]
MMEDAAARVAALPIWRGRVEPRPLAGGITNTNFTVEDDGRRYVVRIGGDIPLHGVLRFNERAASEAAAAAGISPAVIHSEPGVLVLAFVEGRTLTPADIRERAMQERILPLLRRVHRELPNHLRGSVLAFWVFHVIRDYAHTIRDGGHRLAPLLPGWLASAARLERAVGRIDLVLGHNDLLAANFIDDGKRLWLVDWDYAGFNSPLFDLGGLASNNELAEADRLYLLEAYFERRVDDELARQSQAMLTASLLREAMWSMVSELHSAIEFDFQAYTNENLTRFARALEAFDAMERS